MSKIKLAIICSHPIQYYAPVFRLLSQQIELKVFYTMGNSKLRDNGFQQVINWDLPLLEGYPYEFLINKSNKPGTHHFMGIINPDAMEYIYAFKPTSLLIYGWAYFSHLKLLHHFKGKLPILFRGDSVFNPSQYLRNLIKRPLLLWVYKHVDIALYTGTNNKNYFIKYGLKENQLVFAPHAVDNERFASLSAQKPRMSNISNSNSPEIRSVLKLKETDVLMLYAGKFIALKNVAMLIKAFLELDIPHTHLLLVGDGALIHKLKKQCTKQKNAHLKSRIHFMPFQNQSIMPEIYQACDLFCLPSKSESWGLSINEAMAAGKAVLASDKVGAAIDLIHSKNGGIFKSSNLNHLKLMIKRMVQNKDLLKQKGASSLTIITKWSFENQANSLLNAINR